MAVRWTRRVRSVLASVADVTGDWFYYKYLVDREIPNIDSDFLESIFLGICLASTFFGALSILVMGLGCNQVIGCKRVCGITATNWVSFLEVVLEDIPQLVVTSLVSYHIRGPLSSQAVFNLTTSSINFALDILDIADDFADDRTEQNEGGNEGGGGDQNALVY
mmetsp:Transcript_11497/g.22009  ORF Transcript_11497/g.22009 Transcript_11497/m.22009 type:complete len:164 (-) Transcript_11497:119-610(-)